MWRGRPPQHVPIAAALGEPAGALQAALREEAIPENIFWSHLIPLAALYPSLHDLADVALRKTIGAQRASGYVEAFAGYLNHAKVAFPPPIANHPLTLLPLPPPSTLP